MDIFLVSNLNHNKNIQVKKKEKTLQELKDMLKEDLNDMLRVSIIHKIKALDETVDEQVRAPLMERLLNLKPRLEAINAWPRAMVVHFGFGHDWLHGHETRIDFEKQIIQYFKSSTQHGGQFALTYSTAGALNPDNTFCCIIDQLKGKTGTQTQHYLKMFAPGDRQNISIYRDNYHQDTSEGPVFFSEQIVCCPLCSDIHDKKFHEPVKDLIRCGDRYNGRRVIHLDQNLGFQFLRDRDAEHRLKKIVEVAEKVVNGKFFDNGMVLRRCQDCKKLSYFDHWKKIYRQAKDWATDRWVCTNKKQEAVDLLQNLSRLYPEKFKIKAAIKKSILRRAKKIKKIRPLSKGEIIFFSMNLAAAEIKKLKLES